jgi:alkylation response protein AidB-like acyl-CoA dehydrogenase
MKLAVDNELLEAARGLAPLIHEYADQAARERRLPTPVKDTLVEAGLFRMLTPRSLGGLEVDPLTYARITEEIAGFDSTASWALQVGNSADWWCARLPDEGPEEIYADNPSAIIAAAFHPPMQATAVDGGYRVSGRSPLASNIHDADWLFVTALIMEDGQPRLIDGAPQVVGVIARSGEAEIVDTWYSLGMRGTDSNDVALHDVFVPARRSFPLVPEFEPGTHYQGPLYRLSGMGEAGLVLAPVVLGIARAAITELRGLAQGKTSFGSAKVLRERANAQAKLARAEAILRSARLLFYDTLGEEWARARAGVRHTLEQNADATLAGAHVSSSAVEAVDLVYGLAGTSAIYARNPLERHFRDIQTLRHHGFFSESRYETAGQVYLGVPPEFAMVLF